MAESLRWTHQSGTLALQGELDQDLLVPLWEARATVMQGVDTIDLHAVSRVDTAGVALLLHLVAESRAQGRVVQVTGKSEKVDTLIQLYNLSDDLIP